MTSRASASRVLVAGIGYRNLRDYSIGVVACDHLSRRAVPPDIAIEDLSYGPIAVMQRLEDDPPDRRFARLVVVTGVARPGRWPATVTAYRWNGRLPPPDEIQAAVSEAVTGVISADNTLIVCGHFGVLPPTVVVIDSGSSQTAGFQIPDGPTSGIRRSSRLKVSSTVRGMASPDSSRWRVSQSKTRSRISRSASPITFLPRLARYQYDSDWCGCIIQSDD